MSKLLLIDSARYEEWTPPNEDELERMVKEHAQDIFGEQSIFLEKHKLRTKSGIGSIPDGYAITVGDKPHWHIVEVELSTHPLYDHIVQQVSKFINGIRNPSTQKDIVDALYREIDSDDFLKLRLKKAIGETEIHKFLSDLVSKAPVVTIITEKHTEQLDDAISALAHAQIKIVEFQTFTRQGIGLGVHAHLFEPLYLTPAESVNIIPPKPETSPTPKVKGHVTLKNLIDGNILKADQLLYGVHGGKRYEGKILAEGRIMLHDGEIFDSPSGAASKVRGYAEDGWRFWNTTGEDSKQYKLDELRQQYLRKEWR
ncbi:MAG: restriction system modified-DNA reader domain-containing protein [Dehalococcoidia bacterium]